jgi:DsbC/DsbD-like thiol-disulfide interchange protein
MKRISIVIIALLLVVAAHAQILTPVKWSYAAKKTGKNEATLFLKATIDNGWHIYSLHIGEGGPIKTSFTFTPAKTYTLAGKVFEPSPISKYEESFKMKVSYFEKEVIFQQKIKLNTDQAVVKGKLEYMTCNNQKCLPPEDVDFSIPVK